MDISVSNKINTVGLNKTADNASKSHLRQYANLAPLACDTVSFGSSDGNVQLKGIDLAVADKFHAPSETFKTNKDFQNWCKEQTDLILEKDFGTDYSKNDVKAQVSAHRRHLMKEWKEGADSIYISNNKSALTLFVLGSVAEVLEADENALPPVFNERVLSYTISDVANAVSQGEEADFVKLYNANMDHYYSKTTKDIESGEGKTGWVVIPSYEHDSVSYDENVTKLKFLSLDGWPSKSYGAKGFLKTNRPGDFHIYLENGKAKFGISTRDDVNCALKFYGEEPRGLATGGVDPKIPVEYLDIVKEHLNECKLNQGASIANSILHAETD